MWVPVVVAVRTSPSPANVPPVIWTVALARSRLSGSDTERVGDRVSVLPSTNEATDATDDSTGGSLMAVRLTVVVAGALAMLKSSVTTKGTVRVGAEPKSVGFS